MKSLLDIRYVLQYYLTLEWYNLFYILFRKKQKVIPDVISIDDTIKKIVEQKCSISRFGDGEIMLIGHQSIKFQYESKELSDRLIEVLQSNEKNHLVGISDAFNLLSRYNRHARRFWRYHFYIYGWIWDKYLFPNREYYNTYMSRPYIDFKSKKKCGSWFELLKKIWDNRNITIIEGEKSRLGVGNDLFDNASSINRILCPSENAFEKYDIIFQKAKLLDHNDLILIALGPTATVLAYDLHQAGYQAIDIGHVDTEYEWFKMKAKKRVKIPFKYVNEALGGNLVSETADSRYLGQITNRIM